MSAMSALSPSAWRRARLAVVLALPALLAACAGNPYYETTPRDVPPAPRSEPRSAPPSRPGPVIAPPPTQAPRAPSQPDTQRSHPRYAPPPHAPAYWDNRLGVYVVKGSDLYYRERLYYRRNGGWYCAATPDGPWEPVPPQSVPPGLRSR